MLETHADVLYRPIDPALGMDADRSWGVYGRDGGLIDAGAYYRGPGQQLIGQSAHKAWPPSVATADTRAMLYGGVLIDHFGHFLVSSVARLWPILGPGFDRTSIRILFAGMGSAAQWWQLPYVASCFTALGLTHANIVHFPGPTRVPHLVIPRPVFEEHNFIHGAYIDLVRAIGAALPRPLVQIRGPVYLARTRYARIAQGFVNEQALVDRLAALGVTIAYPETMALGAHIDLFRTASVVLGQISSAFHPAAYADTCCPLLMLSPTHIPNPNFGMLDQAGLLPAEYYFVDAPRLPDEPSGRIVSRYVIPDVEALTRDIVGRLRML